MKTRLIGASVGALALVISAATTSSAASATSGPHVAKAVVPGFPVGCGILGEAPFQLTSGGPLIAQAKFTGCTDPAPEECHATVSLQRANPYGSWSTIAHKDMGWGKCSGQFSTSYKCTRTGQNSTFNTQVTLVVEYQGRYGAPSIADSDSRSVDCS